MRCLTLVVFAILAAPLLADENRRYADIEYARVGQTSLRLDLYVPKTAATPPLVLYIHGGDWMYGNKRISPPLFLMDHGFAVASIDYRLAPRARFPAQIQDCRDALIYLYANATRYGFEGSRIGVMGESAGGHLATLLATASNEKAFEGTRRPKDRPKVMAAVSISGPMDLEALADLGDSLEDIVGRNPIQSLLGGRMKDKRALARLASPICHVSPGGPPMLLVYGEQDIVVPSFQAQRMQEAMESAGVPVKTVAIPGLGHDMAAIWQTQTPEHVARFFEACLIRQRPPATKPATRPVHGPSDDPFLTQ